MPIFAFLASPLGKLAGSGLLALVLAGTIFWVKHEWDLGQSAIQIVHQAQRVVVAQKAAVAKTDHLAAHQEQAAQTRIVYRTRTLEKEIVTHVPTSVPCIPWGIVRLHDAAVLHQDPASLPTPAGQPDDACSDVAPRAFVDTVISNYGIADQNAEQLNALEKDVTDRAKAVTEVGARASPAASGSSG